jgi:capsular exopolysaccharide synthesis family protein
LTDDENKRTILITSSQPYEGKSFIASNLAVSIAQGFEKHVILVDADLKHPSLQKIFNLKSKEGLSDFIINEKLELSNLIHKTMVSKLSVLTAGTCYENSSEILSSELMRLFIQELKYRYSDRYVIIDSPPAKISETLALVNQVDGVILVVKTGKTDINLVKNICENIGREKIIGIVMNYYKQNIKNYYSYYNNKGI